MYLQLYVHVVMLYYCLTKGLTLSQLTAVDSMIVFGLNNNWIIL